MLPLIRRGGTVCVTTRWADGHCCSLIKKSRCQILCWEGGWRSERGEGLCWLCVGVHLLCNSPPSCAHTHLWRYDQDGFLRLNASFFLSLDIIQTGIANSVHFIPTMSDWWIVSWNTIFKGLSVSLLVFKNDVSSLNLVYFFCHSKLWTTTWCPKFVPNV